MTNWKKQIDSDFKFAHLNTYSTGLPMRIICLRNSRENMARPLATELFNMFMSNPLWPSRFSDQFQLPVNFRDRLNKSGKVYFNTNRFSHNTLRD